MPFVPKRYRPVPPVQLPDRDWPNRTIAQAPDWCSVDLRDGNQALVEPMGWDRKIALFELLVRLGFKQIEVGFPAASQTEFDFVRRLIQEQRIPTDVTIQVLVQARKDLIDRTFESLRGVPRAIVHLYNSTSTLQRRVVFEKGRAAILELAVQGTRWIREHADGQPETEIVLEYSPESFTGTELDFALEVCNAVSECWGPTPERKMILNLPATVEMSTPNLYADQVEWMDRHLARRDACILSVHTHNDRGTAVAATELAIMAGADRVEGTLFGNGERTGNVDLVTVALNLYSQGVDPKLDFSDIPQVARVYQETCRMPIHPRHPYAGELVFTAFSGSHQDAIRKGLDALGKADQSIWEVPYLPIDPAEVGRVYEPLVRINSQSGKGGVAFVLERVGGYRIPKDLAATFSQSIQRVTDETGAELSPGELVQRFEQEFLPARSRIELREFAVARESAEHCRVRAVLTESGQAIEVSAVGNGPIDAFVKAVNRTFGEEVHVLDYAEHALGAGEGAEAMAYVHLRGNNRTAWGVGRAHDIVAASFAAVTSAVSRLDIAFAREVPVAEVSPSPALQVTVGAVH
ncbi:MAG TPA: 2-isopropylmalate synthase [Polyangiaceae bacterium]|nr:2-isopropylmalate synthase [Polyangiaceae bacterium]